jgi:hypothetical protein
MRFKIEPRDVPLEYAARHLGLRSDEFKTKLPNLIARGFPAPDPDTGNFDLYAIDRWCSARHPHLYNDEKFAFQARDASIVANDRIAKLPVRR